MQGASKMNRAGSFVSNLSGDLAYRSYCPANLPPTPGIQVGTHMTSELLNASRKLAELDSLSRYVPDTALFLSMYVRKEALISSQIEGTQCTLEDILAPGAEMNADLDVSEVLSYVKAVNFAIAEREKLPLCNRLLRNTHAVLLNNARGEDKNPGEFRTSQNWIGASGCSLRDARYVPPNVQDMVSGMSALEKFINEEDGIDPLIKTALVHYQFETIHPFLDGNGRVGRLLILLCLMEWGLLHSPVLYVSYFLKKNQWEYYDRLAGVRNSGDFEQWVLFFLEAVHRGAADAIENIKKLRDLKKHGEEKIARLSRRNDTVSRLFVHLHSCPMITLPSAAESLGVSRGSVSSAVSRLVSLGILSEVTNKARNRIFAYTDYLDILREGT